MDLARGGPATEGRIVTRTHDGIDGWSTWTVHPVDDDPSTLTIEGTMNVPLMRGPVMKLRRMLDGVDPEPFIREAKRRARAAKVD